MPMKKKKCFWKSKWFFGSGLYFYRLFVNLSNLKGLSWVRKETC